MMSIFNSTFPLCRSVFLYTKVQAYVLLFHLDKFVVLFILRQLPACTSELHDFNILSPTLGQKQCH